MLGSLDATASELRSFFQWIERRGAERVLADVRKVQEFAEKIEVLPAGGPSHQGETSIKRGASSDKEILKRVERLLLSDTGLTRPRAIELVSEHLKRLGISEKEIPDSNRLPFGTWLLKLSRIVPTVDLLNIASILRNEAAHGRMAWPLRRESV